MRYDRVMTRLALGIDMGAETLKVALVEQREGGPHFLELEFELHRKEPVAALRRLLLRKGWDRIESVAMTGRLRACVAAYPVPAKAALRIGLETLRPELDAATILDIGAHGFSVLELPGHGQDFFRQNSRCSQGTGNFLSQLVERFGLSIEEAATLADDVEKPCALSGRCPVILKTDMTHLANKGEDRSRILAGLFDAVCENVVTLIRPRFAPPQLMVTGGVGRSRRVRRQIGQWLEARGMTLLPAEAQDEGLAAVGAAVHALREPLAKRSSLELDALFAVKHRESLEHAPRLASALSQVHRMPKLISLGRPGTRDVVLGLDIGSTGSKAVSVDLATGESLWETYLNTEGAPVQASQALLRRFGEQCGNDTRLLAVGVTGSGREVVGSLLRTCYGEDRVFVLNEIAAHARGAVALDPEVDTIFEIGGQDAKYIRLEAGRVIDAAMNEACSAGTGSFIAEQGSKFDANGLHVTELANRALSADHCVSLGQHCSVFMAEIIDEAIAAGEAPNAIIAGLYDSVIQNYLNRVKGTRTVGQRIFCQGMPFASDALAAAVARQTGRQVVVPPNPGTIGALGIALLSSDERGAGLKDQEPLSLERFLGASVSAKETIVCRSTKGCGGGGNHCRIDRLTTCVEGVEQRFLWGGNCSLYDRGATRRKLPDLAPDPFREREALLDALLAEPVADDQAPVVAFPDEFGLKGFGPLFVSFIRELGLRVEVLRDSGAKVLHRGIEESGIPYCAPMQLVHGAYFELADGTSDYLLLPIFRGLPRVSNEEHGTLCPMVIGSSDVIDSLLQAPPGQVLRPTIDFDADGYDGLAFREGMLELATSLGRVAPFERALARAIAEQKGYERECLEIGRRSLAFCREQSVVPVAVLGRPYTIYNDVLNSNVPSILRSLGAMAIPVDCVPLDDAAPTYQRQYWSHTQRNLRVAEFVRRTPDLYSVFCSNYACGPDSFTLHFYAYTMQNKPFAVVETDGHSGDAGTKTRLEAFLYCVDTDRRSQASAAAPRADFARLEATGGDWAAAKARNDIVLLPRMGPQAELAAAALRSEGFRAEALPLSTREDVRMGRRYTSGKECLPMIVTLGTLLNRVVESPDSQQTYSFFMPTANGPCRFGTYNSLHKITLERLGLDERVSVISPSDADYFDGMTAEFSARLWLGFLAHDLIQAMLLHVRPSEREPGTADRLYQRYFDELVSCLQESGVSSIARTVTELTGGMWGVRRVIGDAARAFAQAQTEERDLPTVAVVGEIYVRLDPFSNDDLVRRLEARGMRVHFAPFVEWLEYTNHVSERRILAGRAKSEDQPITTAFTGLIQRVTSRVLYDICRRALGWGERTSIEQVLASGERWVSPALTGEAVLTVGGPVHEFEHGAVDGVVIVGPHECMPCKVSEARFARLAEEMDLPYLATYVSGEGLDLEALDRFTFDLQERKGGRGNHSEAAPRRSGTFGEVSDEALAGQ